MASDKYTAVTMSRKAIFINNLIGGIAWAMGATIGAAVIVTMAGIILSKFDTVPLVGNYVKAINSYISEH